MNKQFKELAIQARVISHNGFNGFNFTGLSPAQEKFAELLVLECINAVMDGTKEGDHYAMRIENHFDNGNYGKLHFRVKE